MFSREFVLEEKNSTTVIGPKMRKLIAKLPHINAQPPFPIGAITIPSVTNSPYYISRNSLHTPSSPSDTPPSGMRGPLTGGPGQLQGSTQPNSDSYSLAQEDDGENENMDGQYDGNYWDEPHQVPFNDQVGGPKNPNHHQSPTHEEIFSLVPENPDNIQNPQQGFGYYGYISEETFSGSGSESWSQLWVELSNIDSPNSPLLLPSSHTSLQLGSSSAYHSPIRDIPREEFENLKISMLLWRIRLGVLKM